MQCIISLAEIVLLGIRPTMLKNMWELLDCQLTISTILRNPVGDRRITTFVFIFPESA